MQQPRPGQNAGNYTGRRSNTEMAITDKQRDLIRVGGSMGSGMIDYHGGDIPVRQVHIIDRQGLEGKRNEWMIRLCGLLVFIEFDEGLRILAATTLGKGTMSIGPGPAFGHTALFAGLILPAIEAPGEQLSHAVMQMEGSPHGGGEIKDG